MPELKNLFIKGKMNKDLDERLLPQGEYRDALDIDVSYSEGSDVGTLQNILGNTKLDSISLSGATCIGSTKDIENGKIYWFITSSTKDIIAEFNGTSIKPILVDVHNGGSNKKLNFSTNKDNFITGANVLDEVLYFTDNLNEPKQVDINYWRGQSNNDFNNTTANFSEDRITVIKKSPLNAPVFSELEPSVRGGNGTIGGPEVYAQLNLFNTDVGDTINIYGSGGGDSSQYRNGTNVFTNASIVPNYNSGISDGDIVTFEHTFETDYGEKIDAVLRAKFTGVSTGADQWLVLTKTTEFPNESVFYRLILEEQEALFELKFARFAYRYKYTNNQFSTISPFSSPAFIPGEYEYTAKDGYNLGMVNTVRKIVLTGWDADFAATASGNPLTVARATNTYEADIKEIEILFKDSVSTNIYIVDTIKESNNSFAATLEIKDEQIFRLIESNQILRTFDRVPKKPKAQEIVGNRLIYGNYQHNFNVTTNPTFAVNAVTRTTDTFDQKLSLKSGRSYQMGITFKDEYGRETPVFTDKTGIITIPYKNADIRQAFSVATTATAPTGATHYKYYIKEASNEYYNIAASNIYEDKETGHIYLSFPSSEVNKVSESDIIVLKKSSGSTAYKLNDNRFKVLDKSSEPPDFLKFKDEIVYATDYLKFGFNFGGGSENHNLAGQVPIPGHNTVLLAEAGRLQDDSSPNEVDAVFRSEITVGDTIRFRKKGTDLISDLYEIKSIVYETVGEFQGEIAFTKPFGQDVNIFDPVTNSSNANEETINDAQLEKINRTELTGAPEFTGKFFIKVNNTAQMKQALFQDAENTQLRTIATKFGIRATPLISGDADLRQLFIVKVSSTESASNATHSGVSSLPSIARGGTTIPAGYHLILETSNNVAHAQDQYANDLFVQGLTVGNYFRWNADASVPASYSSSNTAPYGPTDRNSRRIIQVLTGLSGDQKWFALKFDSPLGGTYPASIGGFANAGFIFSADIRNFSTDFGVVYENPPVFEIEPEEGPLELYYETEKAYEVSELDGNTTNVLPYFNCFGFANGAESDRIRDDFNAPALGKGVRVSTTFEDSYEEETLKTGLIYSGLYNSKSGINRLNQFIIGEKITKDLNPEFGSIQLLHTRDTDIIAFCENNLVKIFANKDAVFNADGNPNLVATNRVLGQAVIPPTFGAYGISKNPESFATHTYRSYFTDKNRGKVLRLSIDGVTEISAYGMKDYFKDKLSVNDGLIVGSFDEQKNLYNVTFTDDSQNEDNNIAYDTVSFSESVSGWPSRKSFLPESAISIKNKYYTFKQGHIYSHGATTTRNKFYGATTATYSHVTSLLNDSPGSIKNFRTLNYQGDTGWSISSIKTNEQEGQISSFVEKEGVYYNYISGEDQNTKASLDLKSLNIQGLGTPSNINGNNATFTNLNAAIQVGDKVYNNSNDTARTVQSISGNTITLDGAPVNSFNYFAKNNKYNTSGLLGYYLETTIRTNSTEPKELYSIGSEVSLSS